MNLGDKERGKVDGICSLDLVDALGDVDRAIYLFRIRLLGGRSERS